MVETSVIIPTYNRLPFLKEAVGSVLNQSYRNFELIIVDDGSTDGTPDFVANLGNQIKHIYKSNGGPSSARNRGLGEAAGEFITFLDSDDLWHKDKLKVEIEFMQSHPEATVCYTDETWIRRGVRVNQRKKHQKYSGWIFERCVPLCMVSPSSVLMRREFFDEVGYFDENLPVCEDYDLWLRASLRFPFHFIPQKLIIKRGGHADQLSAQWGSDRYRVQALLKLLEKEELTFKQRKLVADKLTEKCQILEQGFRKRAKREEANFYYQIRLNLLTKESL
jgi:glycosyltransferase involved in cell wall biosynthesis